MHTGSRGPRILTGLWCKTPIQWLHGLFMLWMCGLGPSVFAQAGVLARIEAQPVHFISPSFLQQLYAQSDDFMLWSSERLIQLLALIDSAHEHGLTPKIGRAHV